MKTDAYPIKTKCPECGSENIIFSTIFSTTRIFHQHKEDEHPPEWWDYEDGDSWELGNDVEFICTDCSNFWHIHDSIDMFTVG